MSKWRINLIAIDSNDSIEILNGGISSGEISAEQMKKWETGRYFLMDITPSVTKKTGLQWWNLKWRDFSRADETMGDRALLPNGYHQ